MRIQTTFLVTALIVAMAIAPGFPVLADDVPKVTIHNYVRAETDLQMRNYVENMDAFWSVTVYNKEGFIEPNDQYAYSVNSLTGTANDDGSFTIYFGGEPGKTNHLPIAEGWIYTVRFYQPGEEIFDGTWKFPAVKPVASK